MSLVPGLCVVSKAWNGLFCTSLQHIVSLSIDFRARHASQEISVISFSIDLGFRVGCPRDEPVLSIWLALLYGKVFVLSGIWSTSHFPN
jgi:hypothetical protein